MANGETEMNIKQTRLKMRWTQGWLAEQLGVAQQTLRNYEKGNTEPPKMIYLAIEHLVEQERRKWV